jgi:hypothetical protein
MGRCSWVWKAGLGSHRETGTYVGELSDIVESAPCSTEPLAAVSGCTWRVSSLRDEILFSRETTSALGFRLSVVIHSTPAPSQARQVGCRSSQRVFFKRQWLQAYDNRLRLRASGRFG